MNPPKTDQDDRWRAAIVELDVDREVPVRAWTVEAAMVLARTLPEAHADVKDDLTTRFANRIANLS